VKPIVLFVFPLLLAVPALAGAAESDCASASTNRERLLCYHDELSNADRELNEAYSVALAKLSPEGAHILREGQLSWLRYVDSLCLDVICASRAYAERMRDLELAAVQKGPFLFSRVDEYSVSVLSAPANQYDTGLATHQVSSPRIDQPITSQTERWNALVVRKGYGSSCDSGDGDTFTGYSLGLATTNLISITWTNWEYCHGTPHGFGGTRVQTLVLSPEPHPLAPDDLFRPEAPWAERLASLLLAGVRQTALDRGGPLNERTAGTVAGVAQDAQRWSLGTDGIGFQFDPYELGAYNFAPHVVIPWADLRDVMVPNPPVR
jgi:uncharacterized protein